jgi:hypothetical protein
MYYLGVKEGVVGEVDEDLCGAAVGSRCGEGDASAAVALLGGVVADVGARLVHLIDLAVAYTCMYESESCGVCVSLSLSLSPCVYIYIYIYIHIYKYIVVHTFIKV